MEDEKKLKEIEKYFEKDLLAIDTQFKESQDLFNNLNEQIERLKDTGSKGGLHYLLESYKNIIALQTQKSAVLKDRVAIKKLILDCYYKNNFSNQTDSDKIIQEMNRRVIMEKSEKIEKPLNINEKEIDGLIDEELKKENNG